VDRACALRAVTLLWLASVLFSDVDELGRTYSQVRVRVWTDDSRP